MSIHHGTLLFLGLLLMISGAIMVFCLGTVHATIPLFVLGVFLGTGGITLVVAGVCMAKKNFQVGVPGHFLLHPPTGTRFSPQQALAIQRRLDRIRREISTDAVSTTPEPEPSLPSTPPPWTMEPPPSYDTVMKSQEHSEQRNQERREEMNQERREEMNQERREEMNQERREEMNQERREEMNQEQREQPGNEHDEQQHLEQTEYIHQEHSQHL
ncbi:PREDICTED: alpha-protein kinase 1-like isoform X2 [Cyprinodon variegatus]|nr:PREDICTED: alpha-protein kinase 1-like isoform X2 [Cyprinodon variegatus]